MADWNTLFYDKKNIEMMPEPEVIKFVGLLKKEFPKEQERKVWDLGCGAGRHSLALGQMDCTVFISDNSSNAIELTKKKLDENKITYTDRLISMENYPWNQKEFLHGVFSWNVLQHNTVKKITEAVNCIHESLVSNGYFLGSIKSTKADLYGKGEEIGKNTFILNEGKEKD